MRALREERAGRRVLVAEDNPGLQTTLVLALQEFGHRPVPASDGAEAWEFLCQDPFDLVLLDVQMPVRDGLSVLSALREARSRVPVLMMSGLSSYSRQALQRGAQGFLRKPFSLGDLEVWLDAFFCQEESKERCKIPLESEAVSHR